MLEETNDVARHHIADHSNYRAHRRAADMAVQRRMGLLPIRWHRTCAGDRAHFVAVRPAIRRPGDVRSARSVAAGPERTVSSTRDDVTHAIPVAFRPGVD